MDDQTERMIRSYIRVRRAPAFGSLFFLIGVPILPLFIWLIGYLDRR